MDTKKATSSRLWARLPGRFRRGLVVASATLLIGWSAAWSQTAPPARQRLAPETNKIGAPTARHPIERLREGTELKEIRGYFRFVNDRVVFFGSSENSRYIGLENLNLERVVSEITNNPTQLEWTIIGTITEYRGANYLLVRRAVLYHSSDFHKLPANSPTSQSSKAQVSPLGKSW
jgi:hypothetical protein